MTRSLFLAFLLLLFAGIAQAQIYHLGTADSAIITDGSVTPAKLDTTNSGTDEYCLTYEATGAKLAYQPCVDVAANYTMTGQWIFGTDWNSSAATSGTVFGQSYTGATNRKLVESDFQIDSSADNAAAMTNHYIYTSTKVGNTKNYGTISGVWSLTDIEGSGTVISAGNYVAEGYLAAAAGTTTAYNSFYSNLKFLSDVTNHIDFDTYLYVYNGSAVDSSVAYKAETPGIEAGGGIGVRRAFWAENQCATGVTNCFPVDIEGTGIARFAPPLQFVPLASPPFSCTSGVYGSTYVDASGPLCVCGPVATIATWSKTSALMDGTCS